jgi:hypothetical protein
MTDSENQKKIREVPKSGLQDYALTTVKAALQAVPVVGSVAAELLGGLVAEPVSKRRDQFMQEVADGLSKLEEKVEGFDIGQLSKNDAFVTAVMTSVQSVGRTHSKEKRAALRNAVLNSAIENSVDDNVQAMFLDFVDRLTPLHLKLLIFFESPRIHYREQNPSAQYDPLNAGIGFVITSTFPELKNKVGILEPILQDLQNRSLMQKLDINLMMTFDGLLEPRITQTGKQFLKFIKSPI